MAALQTSSLLMAKRHVHSYEFYPLRGIRQKFFVFSNSPQNILHFEGMFWNNFFLCFDEAILIAFLGGEGDGEIQSH